MPKVIDGKKTTKKEHEVWKRVKQKTGSGAIATAQIQKMRRKRGK